jgi:hypothetical protein
MLLVCRILSDSNRARAQLRDQTLHPLPVSIGSGTRLLGKTGTKEPSNPESDQPVWQAVAFQRGQKRSDRQNRASSPGIGGLRAYIHVGAVPSS